MKKYTENLKPTLSVFGGMILLCLLMLLGSGCATLDLIRDRLPETPRPPATGWRTDVATFPAHSNAVEFETRNLKPANTPDGKNRDGGYEWIIARIEGQGHRRLLIMVMGGSRPPTRIYHQRPDGSATLDNHAFTVPMGGVHRWRVTGGDPMRIYLDGRQIWQSQFPGTVERIVFMGYPNRGVIGEWRHVQ